MSALVKAESRRPATPPLTDQAPIVADDTVRRPALPVEIFRRFDAPYRRLLAAQRLLFDAKPFPWRGRAGIERFTDAEVEQARACIAAMPSPATLSRMAADLDRALQGPPATVSEIGQVIAAMLDARSGSRAGPQAAYASSLIYVLELELQAEPFTVELLTAAILRLLRQQKFAPEAAEIIEQITPARTAIVNTAQGLDRLIEDVALAHKAVRAADGLTVIEGDQAEDDDAIPF